MKILTTAVLTATALATTTASAEVLFVHNFDNLTDATAEQRLAADYAVGNNQVKILDQSDGVPDTTDAEVLFGTGAYESRSAHEGQAVRTAYHALDNINTEKGSFEGWVNLTSTNQFYRIFHVGNSADSRRLEIYRSSSSNQWVFQASVGTFTNLGTGENTAPGAGEWQYVSADWDFTSADSAERRIRIWINGMYGGEATGFADQGFFVNEDTNMTLFGKNDGPSDTSSLRGYGDSVRITDDLISDLYELDTNGDYNVPTGAFVPEPATLGLMLTGGALLAMRRRP